MQLDYIGILPQWRVGEFWWNFKMWCSLKEPDLFYVEMNKSARIHERICKEESEKWTKSKRMK